MRTRPLAPRRRSGPPIGFPRPKFGPRAGRTPRVAEQHRLQPREWCFLPAAVPQQRHRSRSQHGGERGVRWWVLAVYPSCCHVRGGLSRRRRVTSRCGCIDRFDCPATTPRSRWNGAGPPTEVELNLVKVNEQWRSVPSTFGRTATWSAGWTGSSWLQRRIQPTCPIDHYRCSSPERRKTPDSAVAAYL